MSATCGKPANFKVYWPGREPLPMCDMHATMAQGLAGAMGFYLAMEPQDAGDCSQIVRKEPPDA